MNEKKKVEVLLQVIKKIYDKNLGMQEVIDASMIEACAEEGVSPEQFFFFFCCVFIIMATEEKYLSKIVEEIKISL